jgi:hypothetical protein
MTGSVVILLGQQWQISPDANGMQKVCDTSQKPKSQEYV